MLTLKVTQDTFFQQSTKSLENSLINQKVFVSDKTQFYLKSYIKQGNYYLVRLAENIFPLGNSGFFLAKHIQIEEIKAVWITNVDSNFLISKDNIQVGLEKLNRLGFNTIYPVVWNRGFTLYKSPVAEKVIGLEVAPQFAGRDILAEILEIIEQEKYNFRVIPWFEYGLMTPPNSPLDKNKPEWITKTSTGKKIVDGNCWLNPCHPEVQQFFTELIAEVVERYKIDGIQFDDHLGMPTIMGFDNFTQELYEQEEARAANPKKNPNSSLWKQWRMNKVKNLLTQIFQAVKNKKEDCIISISPNPLQFSIDKYLADWKTWEQDGIVEELVLQVYRPSLKSFEGEINKSEVQNTRNHIPTVLGILTGLRADNKRVPMTLINEQVQATRQRNFAGFSFFFFGSLFELIPASEPLETREQNFARLLYTSV